ncbi:FAD-dependent monooxygenase [Brevibacterium daeguense]|uniref:FAD-dependent monooxygenase n=1 Tax=Brevibacterium daeguense TaxID=909936 RepID=A0ABP8EKC7_9MICO|nr:FAD-dependent monooxygenase [Brevibacterium daeguense]
MTDSHRDAVPIADIPVISTRVLVVGAGPTGLMAALVLRRAGVDAVVIDRKSGPTRESRAVAVQARSMEIYDQLGLAQRIVDQSTLAASFQAGTSAAAVAAGIERMQEADTEFPGLRVFEQSRNEALLSETLVAERAPVRWKHELVSLLSGTRDADAGAEALVAGPSGLIRIAADWCIGADGSRSAVRGMTGAAFDGVTDEGAFWVADTRVTEGLVPGIAAVRMGKKLLTLAFPMSSDGDFRLVGLRTAEMTTDAEVRDRLRREFGIELEAMRWFSTYRIHHRVASEFRTGRVFLAGDAAHVHSPVGGQGMNTGLQDAHNLACLLADVTQGRVGAAALDRYEAERRPVALTLVNVTDRFFGVIGRADSRVALVRRAAVLTVFPIAARLSGTRLGARLGGYLGQYRIRYRFAGGRSWPPPSRVLCRPPAWAAEAVVGLRLPPVGDNHVPLRNFAWQLHTYGTQVPRPTVPDWIDGPHEFPADPRGRLRDDHLYLIRPDGFVAAAVPIVRSRASVSVLAAALHAHHIA